MKNQDKQNEAPIGRSALTGGLGSCEMLNIDINNPKAITMFTYQGPSECLFLSQSDQYQHSKLTCSVGISKRLLSSVAQTLRGLVNLRRLRALLTFHTSDTSHLESFESPVNDETVNPNV